MCLQSKKDTPIVNRRERKKEKKRERDTHTLGEIYDYESSRVEVLSGSVKTTELGKR